MTICSDAPCAFGSTCRVLFTDPPDKPTANLMDFTLVYWDTSLKPAQHTRSRALEKHQVRRYFNGQLESLWKTHPALRWFDNSGDIQRAHAKKFERQGVEFVPLVVEEFELICELDIEFLRPGRSGMVVSDGGDIDNRIKVLLDALRVPTDGAEMQLGPGEINPSRIYCLLEDDKLVTSIKVRTDQLLVPDTADIFEACLVIRVSVKGRGGVDTPYEFRP
jgi:hypothetical protein